MTPAGNIYRIANYPVGVAGPPAQRTDTGHHASISTTATSDHLPFFVAFELFKAASTFIIPHRFPDSRRNRSGMLVELRIPFHPNRHAYHSFDPLRGKGVSPDMMK